MRILILGFSLSGKSAYELLKDNHNVYIYDKKKINMDNYFSYYRLKKELPYFDLVIRSPGIKQTSKIYQLAVSLSKKVISEIELGLSYIQDNYIIGVTGSNGKTTLVNMLYHALSKNNRVHKLGNIGVPLTSKIHEIKKDDIVILELSSFQLENTYRNINIGLVNEMAMLCDRMGIDVWEVIDAAKTKPYGFTAFYPGPGLGGHCIPLDPYYLTWKAREYGFHTSMIEASMTVNDGMPEWCASRTARILNDHGKAAKGAKVLVLGVAYKQDIDDYRESPALRLIERMKVRGMDVSYYDPWVPEYRYKGELQQSIPELTAEALQMVDVVVIACAHSNVDYEFVQKHARAVFDTKNAMKAVAERDNIEVL